MKYDELIKDLERVKYHLTATDHKAVIYDAIDALQSQNADIERLQAARNKAIEEFAARLKKKETTAINCRRFEGVISTDEIDNVAAEMKAEANGNAES